MPGTAIKVLDLFAGAGGLTAGFHAASPRFQTVRAVEMDLAAAASYEATFGAELMHPGSVENWLRNEDVPEVDVIVGGPPCQGFSNLGRRDEEDVRNGLWREYAYTINRAKPKYFVVENVAAFGKSKQFQDFVDATSSGGLISDYDFEFRILDSADYGSPQRRKRAVLLGHHRDLEAPSFPRVTHRGAEATVRQAFEGVPSSTLGQDLPDSYVEYGGKLFRGAFFASQLHLDRRYAAMSLERFASIPENGNRFDLPEHLKAACWINHRSGSGDVMGRLRWDKPSVTIRTEFFKPEKGRYLHPSADRAITHYEAAILQGFPASHRFVGSKTAIAKQIGNAVPIPLGKAIAEALLGVIGVATSNGVVEGSTRMSDTFPAGGSPSQR